MSEGTYAEVKNSVNCTIAPNIISRLTKIKRQTLNRTDG